MSNQKNDKNKEIRFYFPNDESFANYERLERFAVLEGKTIPEVFADLVATYVQRPDLLAVWNRATWVDQNELIDRLETEYQIKTNPQTLYNYRRDGWLPNLFCSDGAKGLLYDLEGVAIIYPQIINRPRTRTAKPKIAATTK